MKKNKTTEVETIKEEQPLTFNLNINLEELENIEMINEAIYSVIEKYYEREWKSNVFKELNKDYNLLTEWKNFINQNNSILFYSDFIYELYNSELYETFEDIWNDFFYVFCISKKIDESITKKLYIRIDWEDNWWYEYEDKFYLVKPVKREVTFYEPI